MASKSKKKGKAPVSMKRKTAPADTGMSADTPLADPIDQLIRGLSDDDEIVRSTAAGKLGHAKAEKAIDPLIAALKDRHVYVRHRAAWALGEIRSERAVDAIREALNDPDEITRGKAGEALSKIQGT